MAGWRNVRIFLSSTFRDMHAERDRLIKVTFPTLRERLLPQRVELYDIDLRWGILRLEAVAVPVRAHGPNPLRPLARQSP
jgi:hypothetical protein